MYSASDDNTFILRTPRERIFGTRAHATQPWTVEVTLRVPRGVHYLMREIPDPGLSLIGLRNAARCQGVFSPRPFALGAPIDRSVARCIYALMAWLCVMRGVDPFDLWYKAHLGGDGFKGTDLVFVQRQAEWEGVVYPKSWGPTTVAQLVAGLRACNDPALADLIDNSFGGSRP